MTTLFNIRRKWVEAGKGKISLAEAEITLSANSFAYTGEPITPGVTVRMNGETLAVNDDYSVDYDSNINIGQGVVKITGMGAYKGVRSKFFYITSSAPVPPPSGWVDFDLAKTASDGGVSGAISMNIQSIANTAGGIAFVDITTNKAYAYGFGSGEKFNASNLVSRYAMDEAFAKACSSIQFADDGATMYALPDAGGLGKPYCLKSTLGNSYDPSSIVSTVELTMSPVEGSIRLPGGTVSFMDGTHIVSKGINYTNEVNSFTLNAPYDFTAIVGSGYNLANYESAVHAKTGESSGHYLYRGLCISTDGLAMITVGRNSNSLASYVMKFTMENPCDVRNATIHSVFKLPTIASADIWNAVCVNDAGTKMMVFGPENKFRSFNLSA